MKTFFLLLFFSKVINLTPSPVSVAGDNLEIELLKPISAITSGASLQIDISSMIEEGEVFDVIKIRKNIEKLFPEKSVSAVVYSNENGSAYLSFEGGIVVNKKEKYLSLYGDVPVGVEWERVVINSNVDLYDVKIYWKNFKP